MLSNDEHNTHNNELGVLSSRESRLGTGGQNASLAEAGLAKGSGDGSEFYGALEAAPWEQARGRGGRGLSSRQQVLFSGVGSCES